MSRDKKVQYDINREVAKILKLWSVKLDKYKNTYKYDYSLSGKAFERWIKTIEDQAKRPVKASKVSKPVEHQQKPEFRKVQLKMNQIKSENCNRKWREMAWSMHRVTTNEFRRFWKMRYFGESSLTGKRTINGTDKMKLIRRKKMLLKAQMLFIKTHS